MKLTDIKIEIEIDYIHATGHEQYSHIPVHVLRGLYNYVQHGAGPGHFLRAVLSNNLFEAVGRADKDALASLAELVIFIYNRVPSICYQIKGTACPRAIDRWIKWHASRAEEVSEQEESTDQD
jgi:hypothetical protein